MEVAKSLLVKVQSFVRNELDDEESKMFASLLAPGVSLAYAPEEVAGFQAGGADAVDSAGDVGSEGVEWRPNGLAEALGTALREGGVRVVGL